MTNEWTGAILLAGLTENFKPFIMGIEASEANITTDKIVSKLLDSQAENATGEAFFNKNSKKKRNKFNKQRKCYTCGSKEK